MSRAEKDPGLLNAAGVPYGEIIRKHRREKGIRQEDLGSLAQVGKNAVGAWEAGRSRPDLSSVPLLCDKLEISLDEFFGMKQEKTDEPGTVPMPSRSVVPEAFARKYEALNDYHRQVVLRQMDVLLDLQRDQEKPRRKWMKIFRNDLSACAGPSWYIGETTGEEILIEENPLTKQADELIRVSGDSMEPEFHDGDQVLVKHGASLRPGEIGIFTNGDAGYIKVYQRDGLHSLNPAYPVMRFGEGDSVRCIGKVLGIAEKDWFYTGDEGA